VKRVGGDADCKFQSSLLPLWEKVPDRADEGSGGRTIPPYGRDERGNIVSQKHLWMKGLCRLMDPSSVSR